MVLIVSQKKKDAVALSHIFYYMHILSFPCTPSTALNEISTLYNAVLIFEPNSLPDSAAFVKNLRDLAPVPVFAISSDPKSCNNDFLFDEVYRFAILSGNLVKLMHTYMWKNGMKLIGDYRYAGLNTACNLKKPTYYFNDVDLTPTERMILSYLIVTNHEQQDPKSITKYAFRHGRTPDISCVRSHISQINKKFIELTTRKIIGCNPGTGYYLITPVNRGVELRKKDKTSHIV